MGYYLRAFCTGSTVPELPTVQKWLRAAGYGVTLDDPARAVQAVQAGAALAPPAALPSGLWEQVAVVYKTGKLPILAACDRRTGQESLAEEEISEFMEMVQAAPVGRSQAQILDHLKHARFVVACQLATTDVDDDGYLAANQFLAFFVQQCGGLLQADGEGFYAGQELLLALK
jgi:hypothetical protein